jgi:uncharacterized protein YhaN
MTKNEKQLRKQIKELEAEIADLKRDRDGFRVSLVSNLKSAIRIHGEGKYWNMSDLIETLSKDIAKRKWWYW